VIRKRSLGMEVLCFLVQHVSRFARLYADSTEGVQECAGVDTFLSI
jgi:hypothetical protein